MISTKETQGTNLAPEAGGRTWFASTLLRPNPFLPRRAWTWDSSKLSVMLFSPQDFCFGLLGFLLFYCLE